jgi:pentapeptide repeat protein
MNRQEPPPPAAAQTPASTIPLPVVEQWKEINANARHWETLIFESAKSYFNVVAFALAGAGAAISWTGVPDATERWAVTGFLVASIVLAVLALVAISSQQSFLNRFYARRRALEEEHEGLELRDSPEGKKSGKTLIALRWGFWISIGLCVGLLILIPFMRRAPLLQGARLQGADLRGAHITQADLEGACGDANTKLPLGLWLPPCQ